MEIHQLRYFVEVVQTGSFTRAAVRCSVTQPTLSHQIKKLEQALGEPLLTRSRKGAQTTAFGRSFFRRAITILGEVKAASEDASAYQGETRGELRIGVIPTIAPYLMPTVLGMARERLPQLTFDISEDTTENLLVSMKEGRVELALLSLPVEGDEWVTEELAQDEILVALPEKHRLAKKKGIQLSDLMSEPIILMKEAHCLRGQALAICNNIGWSPEVFFQSAQIETLVSMVEAGFGVSFAPEIARQRLQGRKLALRSLAPAPVYRSIALVHPRQAAQTRAFRSFLEVCRAGLGKSSA